MKFPVALQVYSVRDFAEKDLEGTFRQIKEMGYDGVELGTVRSAHSVSAAVDQLEEITRQTLSDTPR